MIRKVKVMGIAFVAVLAFSAVAASASHAQGQFTWASGTTKLDATNDPANGHHTFTTDAGSVTCNNVVGSANVTGTGSTQVLSSSITYNNSGSADTCPTAFGSATINMNSCNYRFTAGNTLTATSTTSSETHIVCPGTNKITISALGGICTLTVGSQTIKGGHVVYTTIAGPPKHVTIAATLTGIHYEQHGFCPGGTGTKTNGTYTGNVLIKGTNSSGGSTSVEVH